ncbi:hypothetical protein N7492_001703 [Penicillium capsulatum]|uniref:Xylanolytic transcriptional activator regulatory domain-containing protein n=1 Tax=Penicillium capsulatum TaxID=69766 RepID=A0A9W9M1F8_9EURO|nr:hypothetical protein N7492_001703 [Penicillium capsulatum]KAJ6129245.1 hypothetical protein N7512_002025 [Penicillium capsulatum]
MIGKSLYSTGLSYLGAVLAKPDPVLHVQAYLMCTIHALHSPSSQAVLSMISMTMRCCVISQLHLSINETQVRDASSLLKTQIRRRVFWSTYSIDRLVSWIYHVPCSLADENIQTELFANISDCEIKEWGPKSPSQEKEFVPRQTQVSSALHLIRVRRIQSRILSIMMRADFEKNLLFSHSWRLHLLEELEQWRRQLQPHSDPQSRGYTSQGWVGMAYNYTILLLYRPTVENVRGMVGERCLRACAEILSTFRQYQKDRHTAQLWPGLLSQFGVGITLLYCLWATPPSYRSDAYRLPRISTAVRTCSVILAVFAEQWREADPLRDLFDTLSESTPIGSLSTSVVGTYNIPAQTMSWIHSVMPHIISLVVNRDICRMILDMISDRNPWQDAGYNDCITAWSWEDLHSPHECHLCQNQKEWDPQGASSWQIGEELSMEAGTEGPLDALSDELLSFPGLFGSAEF